MWLSYSGLRPTLIAESPKTSALGAANVAAVAASQTSSPVDGIKQHAPTPKSAAYLVDDDALGVAAFLSSSNPNSSWLAPPAPLLTFGTGTLKRDLRRREIGGDSRGLASSPRAWCNVGEKDGEFSIRCSKNGFINNQWKIPLTELSRNEFGCRWREPGPGRMHRSLRGFLVRP